MTTEPDLHHPSLTADTQGRAYDVSCLATGKTATCEHSRWMDG